MKLALSIAFAFASPPDLSPPAGMFSGRLQACTSSLSVLVFIYFCTEAGNIKQWGPPLSLAPALFYHRRQGHVVF